ncbi:MAG: hypothetical protein ACOYMF_18940 [Bacteroidales bacterium]
MKQLFLLIHLILLTTMFVGAQSVTNVRFEKSGKQVVISYDLMGDKGTTFQIDVYCRQLGKDVLLQKITGACGKSILPGTNKKITWDVLAEFEKLEGDVGFKVEATENKDLGKEQVEAISPDVNKPKPTPNFPPEYYKCKKSKTVWLVSSLVTGGIGAFTYLQAGTTYTQYQSATTDADALHAKADLYNKIAPIALGIAGICTIEFIIKAGKQSKAKKEKLTFYPQPMIGGGGIGLAYNF